MWVICYICISVKAAEPARALDFQLYTLLSFWQRFIKMKNVLFDLVHLPLATWGINTDIFFTCRYYLRHLTRTTTLYNKKIKVCIVVLRTNSNDINIAYFTQVLY